MDILGNLRMRTEKNQKISLVLVIWKLLVCITIFCVSALLIYRACFGYQPVDTSKLRFHKEILIVHLSDVLLATDVFRVCFRAFIMYKEFQLTLRTTLAECIPIEIYFDLISLIPLEQLYDYLIPYSSLSIAGLQIHFMLMSWRLWRLWRIIIFLNSIRIRIFASFIYLTIIWYICTCIWYLIACHYIEEDRFVCRENSWFGNKYVIHSQKSEISTVNNVTLANIFSVYYMSFLLLSNSRSDLSNLTHIERMYLTFIVYIAFFFVRICFYDLIISAITYLRYSKAKFKNYYKTCHDILVDRGANEKNKLLLRKFFASLFRFNRVNNMNTTLEYLSTGSKNEIKYFIGGLLFENSMRLQNLAQDIGMVLSSKVEMHLLLEGQNLYNDCYHHGGLIHVLSGKINVTNFPTTNLKKNISRPLTNTFNLATTLAQIVPGGMVYAEEPTIILYLRKQDVSLSKEIKDREQKEPLDTHATKLLSYYLMRWAKHTFGPTRNFHNLTTRWVFPAGERIAIADERVIGNELRDEIAAMNFPSDRMKILREELFKLNPHKSVKLLWQYYKSLTILKVEKFSNIFENNFFEKDSSTLIIWTTFLTFFLSMTCVTFLTTGLEDIRVVHKEIYNSDILASFLDLLLWLDVLLQMRTAVFECGKKKFDVKSTVVQYLFSQYFVLDMLSIFPYEIFANQLVPYFFLRADSYVPLTQKITSVTLVLRTARILKTIPLMLRISELHTWNEISDFLFGTLLVILVIVWLHIISGSLFWLLCIYDDTYCSCELFYGRCTQVLSVWFHIYLSCYALIIRLIFEYGDRLNWELFDDNLEFRQYLLVFLLMSVVVINLVRGLFISDYITQMRWRISFDTKVKYLRIMLNAKEVPHLSRERIMNDINHLQVIDKSDNYNDMVELPDNVRSFISTSDDIHKYFKDLPLFRGVRNYESLFLDIAPILEYWRYQKGQEIMRAGELLRYVYVVKQGRCYAKWKDVTLMILEEGDHIGLESFISDSGSLFSVMAATDVQVIGLTFYRFKKILEKHSLTYGQEFRPELRLRKRILRSFLNVKETGFGLEWKEQLYSIRRRYVDSIILAKELVGKLKKLVTAEKQVRRYELLINDKNAQLDSDQIKEAPKSYSTRIFNSFAILIIVVNDIILEHKLSNVLKFVSRRIMPIWLLIRGMVCYINAHLIIYLISLNSNNFIVLLLCNTVDICNQTFWLLQVLASTLRQMEYPIQTIKYNSIKTSKRFDLLATFPIDYVVGLLIGDFNHDVVIYLKLNRLLQLVYFSNFFRYLQVTIHTHSKFFLRIRAGLLLIFFHHFGACILFVTTCKWNFNLVENENNVEFSQGYICRGEQWLIDKPIHIDTYFYSFFYFTIIATRTSIPFQLPIDIVEQIKRMGFIIASFAFYEFAVRYFSAQFVKFSLLKDYFHQDRAELMEFLKSFRLTSYVERINNYHKLLWENNRHEEWEDLLRYISPRLRTNLCFDLNALLMMSSNAFSLFSHEQLEKLTETARRVYLPANEILYRTDDVVTDIYFIVNGTCVLIDQDHCEIVTQNGRFKEGVCIFNIGAIMKRPSPITVKALTKVELLRIPLNAVLETVSLEPEKIAELFRIGRHVHYVYLFWTTHQLKQVQRYLPLLEKWRRQAMAHKEKGNIGSAQTISGISSNSEMEFSLGSFGRTERSLETLKRNSTNILHRSVSFESAASKFENSEQYQILSEIYTRLLQVHELCQHEVNGCLDGPLRYGCKNVYYGEPGQSVGGRLHPNTYFGTYDIEGKQHYPYSLSFNDKIPTPKIIHRVEKKNNREKKHSKKKSVRNKFYNFFMIRLPSFVRSLIPKMFSNWFENNIERASTLLLVIFSATTYFLSLTELCFNMKSGKYWMSYHIISDLHFITHIYYFFEMRLNSILYRTLLATFFFITLAPYAVLARLLPYCGIPVYSILSFPKVFRIYFYFNFIAIINRSVLKINRWAYWIGYISFVLSIVYFVTAFVHLLSTNHSFCMRPILTAEEFLIQALNPALEPVVMLFFHADYYKIPESTLLCLFDILLMFFGKVVYIFMFCKLIPLFLSGIKEAAELEDKIFSLNVLLQTVEIDPVVRNHALTSCKKHGNISKNQNINRLLNHFSFSLKMDVYNELISKFVKSVPLLSRLSRAFIRNLSLHTQIHVYQMNDTIIAKDTFAFGFGYIQEGEVEEFSAIPTIYGAGFYFGNLNIDSHMEHPELLNNILQQQSNRTMKGIEKLIVWNKYPRQKHWSNKTDLHFPYDVVAKETTTVLFIPTLFAKNLLEFYPVDRSIIQLYYQRRNYNQD
ncbi:hypothetical protein SNEBB_002408 [Seison nebaliae]|nr:hypothetical protein SNEBB_002408 [Seison nebaliae]